MSPLSLDCPFLVAPYAFSNVYLLMYSLSFGSTRGDHRIYQWGQCLGTRCKNPTRSSSKRLIPDLSMSNKASVLYKKKWNCLCFASAWCHFSFLVVFTLLVFEFSVLWSLNCLCSVSCSKFCLIVHSSLSLRFSLTFIYHLSLICSPTWIFGCMIVA